MEKGDSMFSQSLKNLTIFNFAQLVHANPHPQEKQQPHFRKIGQVVFDLRPPPIEILPRKLGLTAMSHQSFINNSSNK